MLWGRLWSRDRSGRFFTAITRGRCGPHGNQCPHEVFSISSDGMIVAWLLSIDACDTHPPIIEWPTNWSLSKKFVQDSKLFITLYPCVCREELFVQSQWDCVSWYCYRGVSSCHLTSAYVYALYLIGEALPPRVSISNECISFILCAIGSRIISIGGGSRIVVMSTLRSTCELHRFQEHVFILLWRLLLSPAFVWWKIV